MKGLQQKTSKFTVKDFDDTTRIVKGYASVFSNEDSDKDVIMKGAFKRSIKALGPDGADRIKLLAQHDLNRPIGKMMILDEDSKGLYMEAKFGTHRDGDDYYKMAKEGIINEFSVGFQAVQKEANDNGGNNISEIKLWEVSMVTIAANDEAVVTDVKSNSFSTLVKQVEDEDLKFKLEKEHLREITKSTETSIQPAVDDSVFVKEIAPDPEVETKSNLYKEFNKLF